MQGYIKDAKNSKDPINFIDGTKMELTVDEDRSYVCTLYIKDEKGIHPILITAGCCNPKMAKQLFDLVDDTYEAFYGKKSKIMPNFPYVIDAVLPYGVNCFDIFKWTGDFCRVLGWEIMSPESVR